MVDPNNITNLNRTEIELQEYFLFCSTVVEKNEMIHATKLEKFLMPAWCNGLTPFEYIDHLDSTGKLTPMLCSVRLGQYRRLSELFREVVKFDLQSVTIETLQRVIGPKTARVFLLNTRPNQPYIILDREKLKWLRENTCGVTIPQSTPQSRDRYRTIEKLFISSNDTYLLAA